MQRGITTLCVVVGLLIIAVYAVAAAPDCAAQRCVYVPLIAAIGPTVTISPVPTKTPTATDTPVPTATPTATPVPVVLLTNGDFEQGAVLWGPQAAANMTIITNPPSPVVPHSGTHLVQLIAPPFGMGGMEIDQSNVTVPPSTPYLSYWIWIRSTEPICGSDLGGVGINSTAIDTFNLCAATQTDQWALHTLDLSAYTGQVVTVILIADTFDTDTPDSILYIDDIGWRANP